MDERLWSVIELTAIMAQKAYAGVFIEPENPDDKELSNEERNALEEAKKFAERMDFERLFYHYTIDLWKYGDLVDQIRISGNGIEELIPLPMNLVTAVDKRDQINKGLTFSDKVISNPQFYVVDERDTTTNTDMVVLRKERVLHVSFNPRRNWVRDNLGRWTFNVWSNPPITSLYTLIEWKHNLIKNDVLWRNRMLPRMHWQLDLSMFDPSKYTGTHSQKIAAANNDAKIAIDAFNEVAKRMEADQAITTGMGVEGKVIEAKSTNYASPNEIISQINSLISSPAGVPDALVGGESKGFTSLLHSSSFTALRAEIHVKIIKKAFEKLTQRHVSIVRPGIRQSVLDRIKIRDRLILDRDRTELSKIVAILVGSKSFTVDEIRQIWGLDALTEKQAMELVEWIEKTNPKGANMGPEEVTDDVEGREPSSPTGDQESDAQRRRNQNNRGGRTRGRRL